VTLSEIGKFSQYSTNIRSHEDYVESIERYGVSRTDPAFWEQANNPLQSELFDLNH